jgi:hypothetical protein
MTVKHLAHQKAQGVHVCHCVTTLQVYAIVQQHYRCMSLCNDTTGVCHCVTNYSCMSLCNNTTGVCQCGTTLQVYVIVEQH